MKKILLATGIIIAVCIAYFAVYYHADDKAIEALSYGNKTGYGYVFDGPGEDTAVIIYPGAKVEAEAYAPLAKELSDNGIDTYLVDMPLNFPLFGRNKAGEVTEAVGYEDVYMAGHSLGGVAAVSYANENTDVIDGVILLASYPNEKVDEHIRLLTIYGTEDEVLDRDAYEENRQNYPEVYEEHVIEGGNHSGFGSYGEQKGDGKADISGEMQIKETVGSIAEFCR